MLIFGFLFGVSMDYEVFILSRVREGYERTRSTTAGIIEGVSRTGRLVTSAALILFLALASLSTANDVTVRQIAAGLAAGVLLDAVVVRMLLLPALVSLFGRLNWWMPRRAARLLRIRPDMPAADAARERGLLQSIDPQASFSDCLGPMIEKMILQEAKQELGRARLRARRDRARPRTARTARTHPRSA